jgi:NAD+ kinase
MNKIGILYHPENETARQLAGTLQKSLEKKTTAAWTCSSLDGETAISRLDGTDLLLSIGGDGTILRTAQVALASPKSLPITGINTGILGFMTELSADEAETKIPDILDGKGWIDERAMLEAELPTNGKAARFYSLNDVVLARGTVARIVNIDVEIDGSHFVTYRSDGVIVSTATGSTGYSLAAGGPVLHPRAPEIVLTPLVSHLSPSYPLVLPQNTVVKLLIRTRTPAILSIDGHTNAEVSDNTGVLIKRSDRVTRFLRIHKAGSFYVNLEHKLRGKQIK